MKAAVIQLNSGKDIAANLAEVERHLHSAAAQGAVLAVLPENFACMSADIDPLHALAHDLAQGTLQQTLAAMAQRHGLWLVAGTLPLPATDGRLSNSTLVFDAYGQLVARYAKIHLFDVKLPDGEQHAESTLFAPGKQIVVIDSPIGRLGLAICYDLRFPELFRQMVTQGAEVFVLPAAFTQTTGAAHWHALLAARAIENQCHILAAAQQGQHFPGRETYGHSLIVDAWGRTLAELPMGSGVIVAEIDLDAQNALRQRFPVLHHRRLGC